MATVVKRIRLAGSKDSVEMDVVFDDGFLHSCISPELARRLGNVTPLPKPAHFIIKGKRTSSAEWVRLDFYINGTRFSDVFAVVEELPEKAVIGELTLRKWRIDLAPERNEVIFDPEVTRLRLV